MPVNLYDTFTRANQTLTKNTSRPFYFYCCGPTVYGPAHIGNFRTFLIQDVLRRALEVDGFNVKHVRNITDVDDKIIKRASENGDAPMALAERFSKAYKKGTCLSMFPQPQRNQRSVIGTARHRLLNDEFRRSNFSR